jgi:hypothetical protein
MMLIALLIQVVKGRKRRAVNSAYF